MKRAIIIAGVSILGLVVLTKSGIFESLLIFLLAGQIPGTHFAVPSTIMLLTIISIVWLVILRLTAVEVAHTTSTKRSAKRHVEQRKKRMPKRRYSRV